MKTIYALVEPDTRKIRYVGRTGLVLEERARLHYLRRSEGDTPVRQWLRTLDAQPPIEVLQEVEDHEWIAAEKYWIDLLAQVPSVDLLNVREYVGRTYNRGPMKTETRKKIGDAQRGKPKSSGRRTVSDDMIDQIRNAEGLQHHIAARFGVSQALVSMIKHRKGRYK